jgi:TonB family protein
MPTIFLRFFFTTGIAFILFVPSGSAQQLPDSLPVMDCDNPIRLPEFPGGEIALHTYLRNGITYPDSLKDQGVNGICVVQFTIDTTGKVTMISIVKSIHPVLDQQVVCCVEQMPNWQPLLNTSNERHEECTLRLPVSFREN